MKAIHEQLQRDKHAILEANKKDLQVRTARLEGLAGLGVECGAQTPPSTSGGEDDER